MRSDNNNNYCRLYMNKSFCSSYCSTNGLWINKEATGACEERATTAGIMSAKDKFLQFGELLVNLCKNCCVHDGFHRTVPMKLCNCF